MSKTSGLLHTTLALVTALWIVFLPVRAAGIQRDTRSQVIVKTAGQSWRLVSSVLSRQTNKLLRIPSWTGTYEPLLNEASDATDPVQPRHIRQTLSVTVYYFPTPERTKDVMINLTNGGLRADLKTQLHNVTEAQGIYLDVAPNSSLDKPTGPGPGRHLIEVRARRKAVVYTFTSRPFSPQLLNFAQDFLQANRVLGEWKETAILIKAHAGDKELVLTGSVAADEVYRGVLALEETSEVGLDFQVKNAVYRADQSGIQPGPSSPIGGGRVSVDTISDSFKGTTDATGAAHVDVGKLSQKRALRFTVTIPEQDRETVGLLTLRYGRPKEKLLDQGRYQPTPGPASVVEEEVFKKAVEFLRSVFNDDLGRFPRSLDQDKLGSADYTPQPQFLYTFAWRLAKLAKDVDFARALKSCLPLDKLNEAELGSEAGAPLESAEAALALAVETGENGWLKSALQKIRPPGESRQQRGWSERSARRALVLWRAAELSQETAVMQEARRETDQLAKAIGASPDPTELLIARDRIREVPGSGSPGAHAWAAIALFKAFEIQQEASYKAVALTQVQHLMERHLDRGVLGYSHIQEGERAGLSRTTLLQEGAYPEAAAAVHALLLAFHHTHDRAFNDQALAMRSRIFSYWRREYGGFGKTDYFEGSGSGAERDPKLLLKPLVSRRQVSVFQQPWAMITFAQGFYPYWGQAAREEKPSRGLLDILLNRK
jgi:hypothetical protein